MHPKEHLLPSDRASEALQFINTTDAPVFLTGKAGTGKTTFLRNLTQLTHKSHLIVAPTGIAALNAGGVTIHSQFRLPFGMFIPDRFLPAGTEGRCYNERFLLENSPLDRIRRKILRSIELLIIDEVSMLRADLLDAIDHRLRNARGEQRPFGGVQVLFIGDLFQLPPVTKREDQELLSQYYASPWFFDAQVLKSVHLVYVELDKIYRQQDDRFIGLLNRLRNNEVTESDLETINARYQPGITEEQFAGTITLTTHNQQADEINQRSLERIQQPPWTFTAKTTSDFPESMYPVARTLVLKTGSQIMFTRNDYEGKAYFNGRIARVKDITSEQITVQFEDTGDTYEAKTVVWENKKYTTDPESHAVKEEVVGTFEQFPIRLAWAITIHKSQGLTFDRAIINPGRAFADGQVYVALSRLRSLEGLILAAPLRQHAISTDKTILAYTQAIDRPDERSSLIRNKQREFIGQMILRVFDYDPIVREIETGRKKIKAESGGEKDSEKFPGLLAQMLLQERDEQEKTRQKLLTHLDRDQFDFLSELMNRSAKASVNLMWSAISGLFRHTIRIGQTGAKPDYRQFLTDIESQLLLRIEELEKTAVLLHSILTRKDPEDFDALRQQRIRKRKNLLEEARQAAALEPALPDKPKRGRKKADSRQQGL